MRLNRSGPSEAAGLGLKHAAKPWNDAAGVADDLLTGTKNALRSLGGAHSGIKDRYELEHYGVSSGTMGSTVSTRSALCSPPGKNGSKRYAMNAMRSALYCEAPRRN
ncbi:hypothetical protein H9Y04_18630 [Streptomyces sp. TRM66268-LWL]|uniref:Uncharacterized protein n=1 Tax=Streptomyces polyasparticus TaxID=2767826 RepID=A0ABR7SGF8_9ACTN|nr:hypothetical protein [Streptomyces polyasparticus]MBC9714576.1 hypothetical protein [Streptomyces polyasparticus]